MRSSARHALPHLLYNLANVAPADDNLNLAAEDVEAAYRTILEQVKSRRPHRHPSSPAPPRPDDRHVTFEGRPRGRRAAGRVAAAGEVMRLDVSQTPKPRT